MNGFIHSPSDENDNKTIRPTHKLEQRVRLLEKENEGLKKTLKATSSQVQKLLSHCNDGTTRVNLSVENETRFTSYENEKGGDADDTALFDGVHTVDYNCRVKKKKLARMNELRQSYIDGFTTHGLTKSCAGRMWERIFWFICLSIAFCFTIYMCSLYYRHYRRTDIRTEVRITEKDVIPLPTITFCLNLFNRYHCYQNKSIIQGFPGIYDSFCYAPNYPPLKVTSFDYNVQPVSLYPDCITINLDGHIKSYYHFLRISVALTNDSVQAENLRVYMDTPREESSRKDVLIFNPSNMAKINGSYELQLEKQETVRLPSPYTSNCSNGEGIENFFSPLYSRYACLESCWVRLMLESCGTVIDRWMPYVPTDLLHSYKNNMNDTEARDCLYHVLGLVGVPEWCKCPVPCKESDFGPTFIRQSALDEGQKGWFFNFRYKTHKIQYVTEVPEYPFESFLSEVGGLVGLLIGMSALSIIEISVFSLITLTTFFVKLRSSK